MTTEFKLRLEQAVRHRTWWGARQDTQDRYRGTGAHVSMNSGDTNLTHSPYPIRFLLSRRNSLSSTQGYVLPVSARRCTTSRTYPRSHGQFAPTLIFLPSTLARPRPCVPPPVSARLLYFACYGIIYTDCHAFKIALPHSSCTTPHFGKVYNVMNLPLERSSRVTPGPMAAGGAGVGVGRC
jgi:hypothetical protein